MPRIGPPYPPGFRREAVRIVRSSGRLISEADRRLFPTWEAARPVIFEYVEGLYNRVRRRLLLGYVSPADYEQAEMERAAVT